MKTICLLAVLSLSGCMSVHDANPSGYNYALFCGMSRCDGQPHR